MNSKSSSLLYIGLVIVCTICLSGCAGSDCPLNNMVASTYNLYNSKDGSSFAIPDTLTISFAGTDTILLNKSVNTKSFMLPMSYMQETDTLMMKIKRNDYTCVDTIYVSHTNMPHFVSLDCGTSVFHEILGVKWSKREASESIPYSIDSVVIANKHVNYDSKENFKIYYSVK